ncbi:MAG: hypothetical protein SFW36_23705 [Leptolyngbyaceae cyanobacterium bins.59]|nr:hypothetical protein [Leptolyngbyaceae cyanobacterium bins.59]
MDQKISLRQYLRQYLPAVTAALIVCFSEGVFRSVLAQSEDLVIQMPVYGQVTDHNFTTQAELLVSETIQQKFKQNANLSSVRVIVLGDRNGEIIPILTVNVSRTQWQQTPQVRAWGKYNSASYALLQRFQQGVAAVPSNQLPFQIRKSEETLTGLEAQASLSSID